MACAPDAAEIIGLVVVQVVAEARHPHVGGDEDADGVVHLCRVEVVVQQEKHLHGPGLAEVSATGHEAPTSVLASAWEGCAINQVASHTSPASLYVLYVCQSQAFLTNKLLVVALLMFDLGSATACMHRLCEASARNLAFESSSAVTRLHPALPLLRLLPVEQDRGLDPHGAGPAGDQDEGQENEGEPVAHVLFLLGHQRRGAVRDEVPHHDAAELHAARRGPGTTSDDMRRSPVLTQPVACMPACGY